MHFVEESPSRRVSLEARLKLPGKIDEQTIGMLRHILTHRRLRRVIRRGHRPRAGRDRPRDDADLAQGPQRDVRPRRAGGRRPALGGDGLSRRRSSTCRVELARLVERGGRSLSHLANWLVPGRIRAEALVVANDQTLKALPKGYQGKVYEGISESQRQPEGLEAGRAGNSSRPTGSSGSATSGDWSTGRRSTSCSTPSRSWPTAARRLAWRSSAMATPGRSSRRSRGGSA